MTLPLTPQEINEKVAVKLGWRQSSLLGWISPSTHYRTPDDVICQKQNPPDYSGSIEAAWKVVDYLKNEMFSVEIFSKSSSDWHVYFDYWIKEPKLNAYNAGEFLPLVICLAFLALKEPSE